MKMRREKEEGNEKKMHEVARSSTRKRVCIRSLPSSVSLPTRRVALFPLYCYALRDCMCIEELMRHLCPRTGGKRNRQRLWMERKVRRYVDKAARIIAYIVVMPFSFVSRNSDRCVVCRSGRTAAKAESLFVAGTRAFHAL